MSTFETDTFAGTITSPGFRRRLRWGVLLPTFSHNWQKPPPIVTAARWAEELGFDAVWAADHLLSPAPVLDSLTCLAAAAAVTDTVDLGVSVLQLALRPLAWTAKQLATLDAMAPGRLRLGVGLAGEYVEEFIAAGVPRSARKHITDEMLLVLPQLLRGEPVEHHSQNFTATVPKGLKPSLSRIPPISVGGRRQPSLLRTVRFGDQWLPMWLDAETIRSSAQELADLCLKHGRDSVPSIGLLAVTYVDDDERLAHEVASAFSSSQFKLSFDAIEQWTMYGPAAKVAGMIGEYRDAGVSELILMPASDTLDQYERLAEVLKLVEC